MKHTTSLKRKSTLAHTTGRMVDEIINNQFCQKQDMTTIHKISWLQAYIDEFDVKPIPKFFGMYNKERQERVDKAKNWLDKFSYL